jgi:cytochrome c-type biogenesis protein CcmH
MRPLLAVLLFLLHAAPALAVLPDEKLADPDLEARARALSKELRCVVCQNQSIDDSNADIARDLRLLIRERILAGDSDGEIKAYLVERYGAFVLLKPPVNERTWLLWAAPVIVLLIGGGIVVLQVRRRRAAGTEPALSATEEARLRRLLDGDDGGA